MNNKGFKDFTLTKVVKQFPRPLWERVRVRGKKAFTLAEVLITLGVIGVVAAMTMPALITKHRKLQVVNKLKSEVSIIENAVKMAEAKHGSIEEWTCSGTGGECIKEVFDTYLAPELKIEKSCFPVSEECWTTIQSLDGTTGYVDLGWNNALSALLTNGSSMYMWAAASEGSLRHIQIWFDINGPKKGKNMLGADVFGLYVQTQETENEKKGVYFAGSLTRLKTNPIGSADIKTSSSYGCSKEITGIYAGRYCGALIQYEGWKIPDDYPVKF